MIIEVTYRLYTILKILLFEAKDFKNGKWLISWIIGILFLWEFDHIPNILKLERVYTSSIVVQSLHIIGSSVFLIIFACSCWYIIYENIYIYNNTLQMDYAILYSDKKQIFSTCQLFSPSNRRTLIG